MNASSHFKSIAPPINDKNGGFVVLGGLPLLLGLLAGVGVIATAELSTTAEEVKAMDDPVKQAEATAQAGQDPIEVLGVPASGNQASGNQAYLSARFNQPYSHEYENGGHWGGNSQ